ncbi:MAG: TerC/Alx family metal homeostasis membrane protein [Sandaracinaceae bacterium]
MILFGAFLALIVVLLAVDLGIHKKDAEPSLRASIGWTAVWIALGVAFSGVVYWVYATGWSDAQLEGYEGAAAGTEAAVQYLTAYLVEKSLSLDNLFVMALIFGSFRVEPRHQHRVLFWGILGAVVLRALMIGGGLFVLSLFSWVPYVFGAYLAYTGIQLLREDDEDEDPSNGRVVGMIRRVLGISPEPHGGKFTVTSGRRRRLSELALVLLTVEGCDVIFAVDSVPAVLAVTSEPFIAFTSNIFAILGLRSLYFVLADMMGRFSKMKIGLAAILLFVGLKMLLHSVLPIPNGVSLAVIFGLLATSIIASMWLTKREG